MPYEIDSSVISTFRSLVSDDTAPVRSCDILRDQIPMAFGTHDISGWFPDLSVLEKYIQKERSLSQSPEFTSKAPGNRALLLDLMMVALWVYELQVNRVKVNGGVQT